MAGRNLKPKKPLSPIKMPGSQAEWTQLMRQTIARAEVQGDRRIHGLRKALVDGRAERMLRMMGIIHVGDLRRVFPEKV
jgi:hypothetical protein